MLSLASDKTQSASSTSRPWPSHPSVATRPASDAGGWWPRSASGPLGTCRAGPVGHGELVQGVIEQLELFELEDPLAYLHGHYRSVGDLPDRS